MTLRELSDRVKILVQDAAGKLSDGDRDKLIAQSIQQRYSKDRPREIVTDVPGNGAADLDLPGAGEDVFDEGFSLIRQLEYPIGNVPPSTIEDGGWTLYRTPAGLKLRLLASRVPAGESIRVTWTARHRGDGSTVPQCDFEAVCDLAAALCFDALAAIYAQTGDSTIAADTVNYRTKSQEYLGLAKSARRRYFAHIGVAEEADAASASSGPALSIGEVDQSMGWGGDRLVHGRGSR